MKTKNFIISSLLLLVFTISCKDKENNQQSLEKEQVVEVPVKQNFSVELDVSVSKKDDFALYYTEDNTINFTDKIAIWRSVEGNEKREKIPFDLSEEKIPTDIRLDFGMNKEQESVTIYNVKVSYYGNEFSFNGLDFFKYFNENKDFKTEFDVPNKALKIEKNGAEYKTPYFYPTQTTIDNIKKITTEKK